MKRIFNFFTMLVLSLYCVSCTNFADSSEDNDDSCSNFVGETWNLCDFSDIYETKANLTPVSWGEYISFTNHTLYWNSRLGGENTTYTYAVDGDTYMLYRNGYKEYEVSIISKTASRLVLKFDDGLYRWYLKGGHSSNENSFSENSWTDKNNLKNFKLSVLMDNDSLSENTILENENAHTLSFVCSDSETGNTDGLPSVTARWDIISGAGYVSLSSSYGNEVQITNINYSGYTQPVTVQLTIFPEDNTYNNTSLSITMTAAGLVKKNFAALILYDGENISEVPTLESVSDVTLSYSIDSPYVDNFEVTPKWEFESGEASVIKSVTDGCLNVFNANCSGKNQTVTVKLTLTPNSIAYNPATASFSFNLEDSTADLKPREFSSSAELNKKDGSYDGRIKISWTKSENAQAYYVYRNNKQIACVTGRSYYYDSTYESDVSYKNKYLTYYVKAENLGLSSTTKSVIVSVGEFIPEAPENLSVWATKDSDGYYGMFIDWDYDDYTDFEVYRVVSSSSSVSADYIIKYGKTVFLSDYEEKYNSKTGRFSYKARDYDFVDFISRSVYYVHYAVVAVNSYRLTSSYINIMSAPSNVCSDCCSYLVGQPNKFTDMSNRGSSSSSSSGSGTSSSTSSGSTSYEVHCIPCHGSGKCSKCNGKGKYYSDGHYGPNSSTLDRYVKCDRCSGSGKCSYCNGTGRK